MKKKLINLLVFLILVSSASAFIAGNSEVVMTFPECQELEIQVTGDLPIEKGEYNFTNCTETTNNIWSCDCYDKYELIMNIGLTTMNNYTLIANFSDNNIAPIINISYSPNDVGFNRDKTKVILNITTDENATCRFHVGTQNVSSGNINYINMTNDMTYDYVNLIHFHNATVSISCGNAYYYYVRCEDSYGNINNESTQIKFYVEKCYSSSGGSSYTKPTVVINTTNTTPVITPTKVVPTPTPVIKDPTPIKEEPVVIVEEEIEVEGRLSDWMIVVIGIIGLFGVMSLIYFIYWKAKTPGSKGFDYEP